MKMGTIASPWHYDAMTLDALRSPNLRLPSISHFASSRCAFKRLVFCQSQSILRRLSLGTPLLVPAAVGNERPKPRGRRHDQLPRESGKAEHQAWPGARCAVEAADRADDDARAQGRRLDGDVGRTVAQICDEVHALIG